MAFKNRQAELDYFVEQAAAVLNAPSRALSVDWSMGRILHELAVFENRRGIAGERPLEVFHSGTRGHGTVVGLERYRLDIGGRVIPLVLVTNGFASPGPNPLDSLWVVPIEHYRRLYRFLRHKVRLASISKDVAPVMREEDKTRLFDNTVGFLKRGNELLQRYGVPLKRGVLLVGEPGNGKTMACRWLLAQCQQGGLTWRSVETEDYDAARSSGMTNSLFTLEEPGIILFDDFDLGMRNREDVGASRDHSALLAGLDGIEQRRGVVYLFTTNARLSDLDPAFLRRGRIDQVIFFPRPAADLRRRLIREAWHADIVAAVDVEQIVAATEERSFAELEELKKLLVLRFLDTSTWDWPWAWATYQTSAEPSSSSRRIGFAASAVAPALGPLFNSPQPLRADHDSE